MPDWLLSLAGWLYFGLVVFFVLVALLRRREPAAALGWSLAIVFLPGVGILLFLLFGVNRVPRRLRKKIGHHAAFGDRLAVPEEYPEHGAYSETRWGHLGQMLESLGEAPRRCGNRVELYEEGQKAFEAMAAAVRGARHHVHVEFYIFRYDELGRAVIDLLEEKAREGVEVRLLVDAVGSGGNRRMLRRLRKAGGEGAVFLPIRPFGKRVTPNLRNHRKIVVCDGRVGFCGGLNVGKEYLGRTARGREWYDLHIGVEGRAVWDLQRIFVEDWDFCTKTLLAGPAYFPLLDVMDGGGVQILSGGPDVDVNAIRQAFFAAFTQAERSIVLATPYLVPDLSLRDALKTASRSGVDVQILMPAPPGDNLVTQLCGEYYAQELIEAGVRVHAYTPGMMHAKALVVDDEWGMIGTANLDNRSLQLNFEQMAVLDGKDHVLTLANALRGAISRADPLTLQRLADRPLPRRVLSTGSRLLAPLL